jgi:hypothetical protein
VEGENVMKEFCEQCGFELFEGEERFCSDHCEWAARRDLDEDQFGDFAEPRPEAEHAVSN